jgi:hypothetical protein
MAVYLISYDIRVRNKDDDEKVINQLTTMGATRCLYSQWLLDSSSEAQATAAKV